MFGAPIKVPTNSNASKGTPIPIPLFLFNTSSRETPIPYPFVDIRFLSFSSVFPFGISVVRAEKRNSLSVTLEENTGMGAACCCLRPEDIEDLAYNNGSVYEHRSGLGRFFHQLLYMYTSIFHREGIQAITPFTQGTSSTTAGQISYSSDNSFSDVYRSPPMPLPFDADHRCLQLQHSGMVSRCGKASSRFADGHLRRSGSGMEIMPEKWNSSEYDKQLKVGLTDSSKKRLLAKVASGVTCYFPPAGDECPTCLEEYTPEDPKIMTQCSHHFHLSCIYEWKERSDSCPVCGKEMIFSESS